MQGVRILLQEREEDGNYGYFPILIGEGHAKTRDEVYEVLKVHDIYARKYFYPLTSDQACFKNKFKSVSLETARMMAERVLVLPMYEELAYDDIDKICEILDT